LEALGLRDLALDGQKRSGDSHVEVHHVFLTAVGMNMQSQRFAWPRHLHALEGGPNPGKTS
jgi:hypothetical protein